jgi:hypothetical protein
MFLPVSVVGLAGRVLALSIGTSHGRERGFSLVVAALVQQKRWTHVSSVVRSIGAETGRYSVLESGM